MKSKVATFVDARGLPPAVLALVAAAAVVIGGCNGESINDARTGNVTCSVNVLVRFAAEPDAALLADLERTHSLELQPRGAITRDLGVYSLRAVGPEDACDAAMRRLQRDERVRSVDLDAQRELHEEQ